MTITMAMLFLLLSISGVGAQQGSRDNPNANPHDINRVRVGAKAPNFTLEDVSRRKITLSDFRGKKNVVLVFYRGYW